VFVLLWEEEKREERCGGGGGGGSCVEVQSRGRGMLAMGFWAVFMPRPMFFMLKTSCGKRTFRQQV